jgi:hypothetical protein
VTETSGSQAAEHGTLKLIIGGSDSHSPSVWLAVACLVDFWPLVEVARFEHMLARGHGLFRWKVGAMGVSLDRGPTPTLCVYEESESLNRLAKG